MARGLLCVLLLALRDDPDWAGGTQRWHRGFQCPECHDRPEAAPCCWTYCCSAPEARLAQSLSPGERQPSPRPPAAVPAYLLFLLVGICCLWCLYWNLLVQALKIPG